MGLEDENVIRTYLETNFAEALAKGDDAVEEFRNRVATMGPEVVEILNKIAGAEEKVAEAAKEVRTEEEKELGQARKFQQIRLDAEAALAKISKVLDQEEAALMKVAKAEEEAAKAASFDYSGKMQEAAMIAEASRVAAPPLIDRREAGEKAARKGEGQDGKGGLAGVAANSMRLERVGLAIGTGHGIARAGGMLETLAPAAGGPAGAGMAIGALAMAFEVLGPKLEAFIDKMNDVTEATKKAAEESKKYEEQAKRTQAAAEKQLAAPAPWEKAPSAAITKATGAFGEAAVRKAIEDALVNAGGDFGDEANQQLTDMLVANVMAGDPRAVAQFQDIMRFRGGPVAETLRSGRTPAEQAHAMPDWDKMRREAQEKQERAWAAADKAHPDGGPPAPADWGWRHKEQLKEEAANQKKVDDFNKMLNRGVAEADRQPSKQEAIEARSDRMYQAEMRRLQGELQRVGQLVGQGQMGQEMAMGMTANLMSQIDQLMANQRRLWSQWQKMHREAANRPQQLMGN